MTVPSVIWFKRDLRLRDHQPLRAGAAAGPVHLLYVFEPSLWQTEEYSWRQLAFLHASLEALQAALAERGARLDVRVGEVVEVLEQLRCHHGGFGVLRSHQETGNHTTFARDITIGEWCRARGVQWIEAEQDGVVRGLRDRDGDGWTARWQRSMDQPVAPAPDRIRDAGWKSCPLPSLSQLAGRLGVACRPVPDLDAGEAAAHAILDDFLQRRGARYATGMSSPATAPETCSRLSPHLAVGSISMRQVHHKQRVRQEELRAQRARGVDTAGWEDSLHAFGARLRWRSHFMQKLEDEPEIEFHALSSALEEVGREPDEARLQAWRKGETGVPMVDACMRMLRAGGWINFRMRAMLQSFASHQLWLPWQDTGRVLAAEFTDFEPGIHWARVQRQSGVTGMSSLRIYSPVKQAREHDPDGSFLAHWLPELERVPVEHRAAPWEMPPSVAASCGFRVGEHYPAPQVDPTEAARAAARRMRAARATAFARAEAERVYTQHGARRRRPHMP